MAVIIAAEAHAFVARVDDVAPCAQGLEVTARGVTPEIVDVVEMTDHEPGKKRFYQHFG